MADTQPISTEAALEDNSGLIQKKKRDDNEMDITPMIDITFLLLIFFLVASKMDESAAVKLPKARHGSQVSNTDALVILVTKGPGEDGLVKRFNGTPFTYGDLAREEQEIGEYIEAGLAGTPPFDAPKKEIMIRGERGIKHGDISRVTKAIGKVTDTPVLYIAVLEEQ